MPVVRLPVVCPGCGTAFTAVVVLPRPGRVEPPPENVRVTCRRRFCRRPFDVPVDPHRRHPADTPPPPR